MKKLLLLFASAAVLSINLATAQSTTPGRFTTYAYDDFKQVNQYTNADGSGIYWYSGNASAVNGTRVVGSSTFAYTNTAAGATYLAADFGSNTTVGFLNLDLSSMADIEVDLKNTSTTADLQLRVYLKDYNNHYLEIEPNISDCVGVPNFSTPNPNATWTGSNLVYPAPSDQNAVYPRVAYNGFVIPKNTRKTYRIDLSSVSTAKGGRKVGTYINNSTPINSPQSSVSNTSTSYTFDITKVHAVEFSFNENTAFTLSDGALDTTSYKYDADGISQSDYTGSIVFYSFKIGSILSPLTATGTTPAAIVDDAVVDGSLKVYPNPANESLNVSFESNYGGSITLSDIVGNTAYTTVASAGQNQVKVNTSDLTPGMYILTVTTEKGKASRKISIE